MKFAARIGMQITADSPEEAEEILINYIRTGVRTTAFIEMVQMEEEEEKHDVEEAVMDYQKLLAPLNTDKMEKN